jgi:tRNA A-37 threonylcarbamoyl transferase component Bud32
MGLRTPVVYLVEHEANTIYMEMVEGKTVKDLLAEDGLEEKLVTELLENVGEAMAIMHDGGLVHNNYTVSNLMIEAITGKVVRPSL